MVVAIHGLARVIAVLVFVATGCGTHGETSVPSRVELRIARREDASARNYILDGLLGAQPVVAYGTRNAHELHLPRGESVQLEVRTNTPFVLSLEGGDEELAIRPGTTFVHVRVTDGTTTALVGARRCERGPCLGRIPIVLEDPAVHREWLRAGILAEQHAPAACGEVFFASKGCAACHLEPDRGQGGAGGSLRSLLGTTRTFADGSQLTLDDERALDAYVRDSITHPHVQVVAGRRDVMPHILVSEDELTALVAYVRCLSVPCEKPGCAALCDEDSATLLTAGFAGPHGPLRGCSGFADARSGP